MARRQFGWRPVVLALGLATCTAGVDGAAGQDGLEAELLYEKALDLSVNRARADDPREGVPAKAEEAFVEKSIGVPTLGHDGVGGEGMQGIRVVHGEKAEKGTWLSTVHVSVRREGMEKPVFACGGTVIGERWVLTAAHCVFDRRNGGVRSLVAATVYGRSVNRFDVVDRFDGEVLRVARVIVHPEFARLPGMRNDVALLELEKATTIDRQKLAAQAGQSTFLSPGTTATIVGWGITTPMLPRVPPDPTRNASSKLLLWARVPIASEQACSGFLKRPQTSAEFCAGDFQGGPDSCRGDSGGPIFVAGHAGETIQAGIISWGPGCAQQEAYGVYAAVGHFQAWIGKYVPDAEFALPRGTVPALATIAGHKPGDAPAPHGQVTVDLLAYECPNPNHPFKAAGKAANRIKAGSCVKIQVTSGVTGHLAIFNTNANGTTELIFPNRWSGRQKGQAPTQVRAGQVIKIPGPVDPPIKAGAPFGRNELLAIVVPEGVGLAAATRRLSTLRSINLRDELSEIARRLSLVDPLAPRAVGTRQFEVVE